MPFYPELSKSQHLNFESTASCKRSRILEHQSKWWRLLYTKVVLCKISPHPCLNPLHEILSHEDIIAEIALAKSFAKKKSSNFDADTKSGK